MQNVLMGCFNQRGGGLETISRNSSCLSMLRPFFLPPLVGGSQREGATLRHSTLTLALSHPGRGKTGGMFTPYNLLLLLQRPRGYQFSDAFLTVPEDGLQHVLVVAPQSGRRARNPGRRTRESET